MTTRSRKREKAGRVTDVDGYKTAKRASGSHNRRTTATIGEGDVALIRTAVEERWPVDKERREPLANMLLEIALDPESKADSQIQAARTVLTMEAQNQKDEHLIFQLENAKPQLHIHGSVDPEQCRTRILAAVNAEIERRKLPPGDGPSDNGRERGNGQATSETS